MQNCKWIRKACGVVGIGPLRGLASVAVMIVGSIASLIASLIACLISCLISVDASAHLALVDGSGLYVDYECARTPGAHERYPTTVRLLSREADLLPHFLELSGVVAQLQLLKERGVKGSITLIPQRRTIFGDFAVLLPHANPAVASIIAGPRSDLSEVYICHSID